MKTASRYLHLNNKIYWRISLEYSNKEKDEIKKYFPDENQEQALKETEEHVSVFMSCLIASLPRSEDFSQKPRTLLPKNIKRTEIVKQFEKLSESIKSLENSMEFLWRQPTHPMTCKFKQLVYNYPLSGEAFHEFDDFLLGLKAASAEMQKSPGNPGRKDPYYYEAIYHLANVWKKYTGKEPTLHSKEVEVNKYLKGQKYTSPFYKYAKFFIESAVFSAEKSRNIKVPSVSISNIVREVIKHRKLNKQSRPHSKRAMTKKSVK